MGFEKFGSREEDIVLDTNSTDPEHYKKYIAWAEGRKNVSGVDKSTTEDLDEGIELAQKRLAEVEKAA